MGKYGTLIIQPCSARLYRDVQTFGKMDPYVVVKIGDQSAKTSVHKDAGKFPSWKDKLAIKTKGQDSCIIQIWDKNSFSKDKLICSVQYFLFEAYQKQYTKWIILQHKGKKAAQLNCDFKFLTQTQEISYQAITSIAHGQPLPMTMISQPPPAAAAAASSQAQPHPYAQPTLPPPPPQPYNILQSPVYQGFAQSSSAASPAFYAPQMYSSPMPQLGPIHTEPPQSYHHPSSSHYPPPCQMAPGFIPHSQSMYIPPQSGVGAPPPPAYGASYIPPPQGPEAFGQQQQQQYPSPPPPPPYQSAAGGAAPPYGGSGGTMYVPGSSSSGTSSSSNYYQPQQ